ncbi:MAG: pentapeptide repeat-containing protein, partial [Myxococcota bacterium]|nr:pentapeptide repeat-containing protein [Myxococcota bacterium]
EKVTLDRADLSFATLDDAQLTEVYARDANLAEASARRAAFVRCQFARSVMDLFKAPSATLDACDFTAARLIRSVWYETTFRGCTFRGADLTDALLSGATFLDCDFRDADLAITSTTFAGSTHQTQFLRCDLRGVRLAGRDLDRVRMVDCKVAGTRCRPIVHDAIIERPDLSESADGSRIAAASDLLAIWSRAPDA